MQNSASTMRIKDFGSFSELFSTWDGDFQQLSRGPFKGTMHANSGRHVRVFQVELNQAVRTQGHDSEFATFIPLRASSAQNIWRGNRLDRGQIIAKGGQAEYENTSARGSEVRALMVPRHVLAQAYGTMSGGQDVDGIWSTWHALRPSGNRFSVFDRSLSQLLHASVQGDLGTEKGEALEVACLRALVEVLLGEPDTPPTHTREQALLKGVVDLMQANRHKPLSAMDLCAEFGTSDRTLRRLFKTTFGIGPIAFHRAMRLNAVRTQLKNDKGSGISVSKVAASWGFCRGGSFAHEYRQHFGEFPSETLGVRGWRGVQEMARLQAEHLAPIR